MPFWSKPVIVSVMGEYLPLEATKQPQQLPDLTHPPPFEDSGPVENYQAACRAIGRALAKKKHPIVLCVADWEEYAKNKDAHPADFVLEGAIAAGTDVDVTLYQSPRTPPPTLDVNRTLVHALIHPETRGRVKLQTELLPTISEYYPESFPSISHAEATILLGGRDIHEFVAMVGHEAKHQPIVALSAFGGAGRVLYRSVLQKTYRQSAQTSRDIRELLPVLEASWKRQPAESAPGKLGAPSPDVSADTKRANDIEKLTQQLASTMRTIERRDKHAWDILAGITIAVFVVWALLFTLLCNAGYLASSEKSAKSATTAVATAGPTAAVTAAVTATATAAVTPIATAGPTRPVAPVGLLDPVRPPNLADFIANMLLWGLVMLSCALGLSLRYLAAHRAGRIAHLHRTPLLIDLAAAILIALGFCVLFFIGYWAANPTDALPGVSDRTTPVAAALSGIGLACGFLLPLQQLTSRLRQYISQEQSAPQSPPGSHPK